MAGATLPRAAAALLLLAAAASAQPSAHPCTWATFPAGTPSHTWPDGPHLGDGNQGLVIGGAPGEVTIYGTVHGFWGASFGANASMPPLAGAAGAAPPLGFPGCPSQNCSITVGLTLARVMIAAPQLGGAGATWNATLDIAAGTATVDLRSGSAGLRLVLLQHATAAVGLLTLANTGSVPLSPLNVTLAGNGNIRNVTLVPGCGLGEAGGACPALPSGGAAGLPPPLSLTKDANAPGIASPLPIQGAAGLAPLGYTGAPGTTLAVLPYAATEPAGDWARGGAQVPTLTAGLTLQLALPPGSTAAFATAMAASNDPGVTPGPPLAAVAARVAPVALGDLPALARSHAAWWASFYAASSVSLQGEAPTEAFFWSTLYALGSGTRAGQPVMDLWSPWRTTDYSAWRSNPTMDYNQQALYSGVYALNHLELAQPYYDFLSQAVASGGPALEAAALGCPSGIHLSVDLAPFGLKMGVRGEVQDWGIRSNAVYAAISYSYHWDVVPHDDAGALAWARDTALPFLKPVAAFWACYLQRRSVPGAPDGYRYWSVGDCDGDEGCNLPPAQATNPVWTTTYLRRLLVTLLSMAAALQQAPEAAWGDVLAHLPPTATVGVALPATHGALTQVLAVYGEGAEASNVTTTHALASGQQAGYLHSLWPGETLSPLSEADGALAGAALASATLAPYRQDNSFSWVFSAAARAGVAPNATLARWRAGLLTPPVRANRLLAWGGLCSDSLGAVQYVVDMLVQGREGFLRAFPAWPANASAGFATLRLPGALLVSGSYSGVAGAGGGVSGEQAGGTQWLDVAALGAAGGGSPPRAVAVLSPWQAAGRSRVVVCRGAGGACAGGAAHEPLAWRAVGGARGGDAFSWQADASGGVVYTVFLAPAGGA